MPLFRRRIRRTRGAVVAPPLWFASIVCIVLVGCTDIITPKVAAPTGEISTSAGPVSLGEGQLSPPATSTASDISSLQFQPFAHPSAGKWVVIRTSGHVGTQLNEACQKAATPSWGCGTGSTLGPFSPDYPWPSGPVHVRLTRGTGYTDVGMRGSGYGAAVGLIYATSGGTLSAKLSLPVNQLSKPGIDPIGAYFFSGGYSISAAEIPPPAQITEGAADASGMREFSIAPLYGLEFVNPGQPYYFRYWKAGAVTWKFIPGENVGDVRAPGDGAAILLGGCEHDVVCAYRPKGPGRMEATAYVEGRQVTVRSTGVPATVVDLKCNGAEDSVTITRADELACRVSGTTDIIRWEFTADSSNYRNPSYGGTPFRGAEWTGKVVLSGTVSVTTGVAGQEETKSLRVRVNARDWTGQAMPRTISENPVPDLPLRPDSVHDLGRIVQTMELELLRDEWEPILSGPNANLAYLVKVPVEYVGVVHVNRAALSPGSDFWNAQYTRQRTSGVVDCLQRESDIVGFIPVILRHEGIGFDPKSHAYLYVTAADSVGNPQYEKVVAATLQELADQSAAIRAVARDVAVAATARADSTGYAPRWCRFHFNYRGR